MKRTVIALTMILTLLSAAVLPAGTLASTPPAPAPAARQLTLPIVGTVVGGTLTNATFTPTRFVTQNGNLALQGTLVGTLTNTATGVVTTIVRTITLAVTGVTGTCEILDLQLGPLDLDLLGLVVHLDQINLNITAEAGPGNLLGNLLCAVAGLLDAGGPLSSLLGLLNNILRNL